ncbi:FAD-dependent oxidoreductase [Corynebacterium sp. S7]
MIRKVLRWSPRAFMRVVTGSYRYTTLTDATVRVFPHLIQRVGTSATSADFVFVTDRKVSYRPGQYMEWTLPHTGVDARGNRRYFTLASSPTEPNLRLGVKFNDPSSSYKRAMASMNYDTPMVAAHVAGDFVLPRNKRKKLVFIAGGIGVTPFRSMVKYLLDMNEPRDIIILYAAKNSSEIAYADVFEQARTQLGLSTTYVYSQPTHSQIDTPYIRTGHIDGPTIQATVPDLKNRTFMISGSQQMVDSVESVLLQLGVSRHKIKTDFFPGFVEGADSRDHHQKGARLATLNL